MAKTLLSSSINKTKKTVKVKIERKVVKQLVVIEKLDPSKVTNKKSRNRVALIIGIENYLSPNVRMKFCKGEFPTLLQILVTPIEPSGTPAEVKGRKKDKTWLSDKTLKYVRENDEDQKYEGGKWSRYCRKRFPQHHEINY